MLSNLHEETAKEMKPLAITLGAVIIALIWVTILSSWAKLFGWQWVGKVALECAGAIAVYCFALALIAYGTHKK